jgi:molecular chaperone DnaK (HSP70)
MITWAASNTEFKEKAAQLCDDLELFVEDVEDDMPVSERTKFQALSDEAQELVEQAESNPDAVLYGTFHRWLTEDRI